jgi:hypothetical protein
MCAEVNLRMVQRMYICLVVHPVKRDAPEVGHRAILETEGVVREESG